MGNFLPLTFLITQKIKILEKRKKCLRMLFYTCVPEMKIIWCIVRQKWSETDIIWSHFGPFFCSFIHLTTRQKKLLKKRKKRLEVYLHFLKVCHKWQSHNVWFLRYKAWHNFLLFWTIFCPFTTIATQRPKFLKKWKTRLEISSHKRNKSRDHMLYCCWDMERNRCICYFSFCAFFALLPP